MFSSCTVPSRKGTSLLRTKRLLVVNSVRNDVRNFERSGLRARESSIMVATIPMDVSTMSHWLRSYNLLLQRKKKRIVCLGVLEKILSIVLMES